MLKKFGVWGKIIMVEKLIKIVGKQNVKINEPLKNHCTFGIGGSAKYYVSPENFEALNKLLYFAKLADIKFMVVGKGSNCLFDSLGYDGIIISTEKLSKIVNLGSGYFEAMAGTSLAELLTYTSNLGFGGLEFASGIPGSIGGAILMNAGANGHEIGELVKYVAYYEAGERKVKQASELDFGYRTSYFLSHKDCIIASVVVKLKQEEPKVIYNKILELVAKRRQTQPLGRSAGCVFKKCGDMPAGLLIDRCGLKGIKIGGAEISTMHANFILNSNDATSADVISLIELIRSQVKNKYNKELELEIEIIEK